MAIYSRKNQRDRLTYWFIRYERPDGKRKKEKAGTTKQEAKELLVQRLHEMNSGEYVDPGDRCGTFAELAERFLREYASERRSTYYRDTITGRISTLDQWIECGPNSAPSRSESL
jgi:hypothetical protein